jgi:hypothetical protein
VKRNVKGQTTIRLLNAWAQLELIVFHQQKSYFACGPMKRACAYGVLKSKKKLADQITTPKDRMGYAEERMRLSLKKRQKLHL